MTGLLEVFSQISPETGLPDPVKFTSGVALALTKMIARDGEGATKLIEVFVDGARDDAQAKRVADGLRHGCGFKSVRLIVNRSATKTYPREIADWVERFRAAAEAA